MPSISDFFTKLDAFDLLLGVLTIFLILLINEWHRLKQWWKEKK